MEEFLKEKHAEEYGGLDDDMSDAFDNWMLDLDVDEWIMYADSFALQQKVLQLSAFETLLNNREALN